MAILISGMPGAIDMNAEGAAISMASPRCFPGSGPAVVLEKLATPRFLVTVDTEEEFDWAGPFTRDQHGLTHLASIEPFQKLCEENGVKPVYLVDYPVVADDFGAQLFADWVKNGMAEVGLQLHPWVTPPFVETINGPNSYACNLSPDVEAAKLTQLYEMVEQRLGVKALSYRAGRYGAGAATADILVKLGIRVDTSVRSLFDYSRQDGPNYARSALTPYWVKPGHLIELPVTSVFSGMFRSMGPLLFDKVFGSDTMRSILARGGMLERLALTPEGIPVDKAITAIDCALEIGLPILTFSFHSPSLAVGHTPYVRNDADLENFYTWWEAIFTHLAKCGVEPVTIAEVSEAAFVI